MSSTHIGAEGDGKGSTGYQRKGGQTATLTPFQVPESPTSAAGPFPPSTDPGPMTLLVLLWFAALVVAIAAVGRALAPPSVRHLAHTLPR